MEETKVSEYVDDETRDILKEIVELGFVCIRDGKIVCSVEPEFNVYSNVPSFQPYWRWDTTIQYLKEYSTYHPDFTGCFYVCAYDGFREFSAYSTPERRKYVPWKKVNHSMYTSCKGNANEPRFVHGPDTDTNIYPELNYSVLAYNRHINDRNTLLIPDAHFLLNNHSEYLKQLQYDDTDWTRKNNQCILWRGSRNVPVNTHTPYTYNSHGMYGYHIRDIAVEFSRRGVVSGLDASFDYMPVVDQLRYKYLLTCDGLVSAWSAIAWKLCSQSVLVQVKSSWEHWYSKMLIPEQHYVSLDTLFDIPCTLSYLQKHDDKAREINTRARALGSLVLTRRFAVQDYYIH